MSDDDEIIFKIYGDSHVGPKHHFMEHLNKFMAESKHSRFQFPPIYEAHVHNNLKIRCLLFVKFYTRVGFTDTSNDLKKISEDYIQIGKSINDFFLDTGK